MTFNLLFSISGFDTRLLKSLTLTSPRRPTWQQERKNHLTLLFHQDFRKHFPPYGRTNTWCCSKQSTRSWSRPYFGSWKLWLTYGWSKELHVSALEVNHWHDLWIIIIVNNSCMELQRKETASFNSALSIQIRYCISACCWCNCLLIYFLQTERLHLRSTIKCIKLVFFISERSTCRDALLVSRAP